VPNGGGGGLRCLNPVSSRGSGIYSNRGGEIGHGVCIKREKVGKIAMGAWVEKKGGDADHLVQETRGEAGEGDNKNPSQSRLGEVKKRLGRATNAFRKPGGLRKVVGIRAINLVPNRGN